MIPDVLARILYPTRQAFHGSDTSENVDAFIESRALEYSTKLDDEFVARALALGVENGVMLDVGTRVGLIALKILWQNENLFAIGVDPSGLMIERARETANAWGLGERAFFQVGDARRMRFKTGYFDLVVSDGVLHASDDPLSALTEMRRVLKPKGALLIRDFRRSNRFRMARHVELLGKRYGSRMKEQVGQAVRAGYTENELRKLVRAAAIPGATVCAAGDAHLEIERRGVTDPNSWVTAREQYR